jgi:hypothetical protein
MDSPVEYFKQAEAFLKSHEDIMRDIFQKDLYTSEYRKQMASVALTNHAFSCEIYLKCILLIENNLKGSHDLLKLYNYIQNKQRIIEIYDSLKKFDPNKTIEDVFSKAENAYTRFRYMFQESTIPETGKVAIYGIDYALLAIRRYLIESNPDWPCILDASKTI